MKASDLLYRLDCYGHIDVLTIHTVTDKTYICLRPDSSKATYRVRKKAVNPEQHPRRFLRDDCYYSSMRKLEKAFAQLVDHEQEQLNKLKIRLHDFKKSQENNKSEAV